MPRLREAHTRLWLRDRAHQKAGEGGGDPAINSRVRIGMRAAELEVLDETAFSTAADMRLNPEYGEWIRTWDMHHTCLTNLVKEPDQHAGLALLRSERQGNVNGEQKRAFAALAAHARSAVRTHMALEAQGAQLLAGAMEAMRATAFVCDETGRVARHDQLSRGPAVGR